MKKLIFVFLLLSVCVVANGQEKETNHLFDPWYVNVPLADHEHSYKTKSKNRAEISLYDKTGYAKVYLEAREKPGANDLTFYLWSGHPVAYVSEIHNNKGHVYSFRGEHIGWIHSGICFDNNGYAVCAIKSKIRTAIYAKSARGAKKVKRCKGAKQCVPPEPVFKNMWSSTSLEEFFSY